MHHFYEEQDPDSHQRTESDSDSDPHQSENKDPDPQHCLNYEIITILLCVCRCWGGSVIHYKNRKYKDDMTCILLRFSLASDFPEQ